jgi:hypothetical protein
MTSGNSTGIRSGCHRQSVLHNALKASARSIRHELSGITRHMFERGFKFVVAGFAASVFTVCFLGCRPDSTSSDPELKELTKDWSGQQRANFHKALEGASATVRSEVIQDMLRERREALTIDYKLVKWRPGDRDFVASWDRFPPFVGSGLSQADLQALRDLNLKGTWESAGSGSQGSAPKRVRVVIIMQHQIEEPFQFAVPSAGTLVCIQFDKEWRLVPAEYPKSKKTMELVRSSEKVTSLVKNDGGGMTAGTAFTWE